MSLKVHPFHVCLLSLVDSAKKSSQAAAGVEAQDQADNKRAVVDFVIARLVNLEGLGALSPAQQLDELRLFVDFPMLMSRVREVCLAVAVAAERQLRELDSLSKIHRFLLSQTEKRVEKPAGKIVKGCLLTLFCRAVLVRVRTQNFAELLHLTTLFGRFLTGTAPQEAAQQFLDPALRLPILAAARVGFEQNETFVRDSAAAAFLGLGEQPVEVFIDALTQTPAIAASRFHSFVDRSTPDFFPATPNGLVQKAVLMRGFLEVKNGQFTEAQTTLAEAVRFAQNNKDEATLASALVLLAHLARRRCDPVALKAALENFTSFKASQQFSLALFYAGLFQLDLEAMVSEPERDPRGLVPSIPTLLKKVFGVIEDAAFLPRQPRHVVGEEFERCATGLIKRLVDHGRDWLSLAFRALLPLNPPGPPSVVMARLFFKAATVAASTSLPFALAFARTRSDLAAHNRHSALAAEEKIKRIFLKRLGAPAANNKEAQEEPFRAERLASKAEYLHSLLDNDDARGVLRDISPILASVKKAGLPEVEAKVRVAGAIALGMLGQRRMALDELSQIELLVARGDAELRTRHHSATALLLFEENPADPEIFPRLRLALSTAADIADVCAFEKALFLTATCFLTSGDHAKAETIASTFMKLQRVKELAAPRIAAAEGFEATLRVAGDVRTLLLAILPPDLRL